MKIAYIDHSFHQKTRSNDFFFDIFAKRYETKRFWDYRWKGGRGVSFDRVKDEGFDTILLNQIFYDPRVLTRKYGFKKIIWAPQADSHGGKNYEFFSCFREYKIIAFSKEMFTKSVLADVPTIYLQYFPKLSNNFFERDFDAIKLFFWYRIKSVNLETISILFKDYKVKEVLLHNVPDPPYGKAKIPKGFPFKITETLWFNSREEYLKIVKNASFYIAPRLREGIGLSYLEAMANGLIVVGHNEPTMNEYIEDEKTGFLFDAFNPKKLDFLDSKALKNMQKNLYRSSLRMYEKWEEDKNKIYDFIESLGKKYLIKDKNNVMEKINEPTPEVLAEMANYFFYKRDKINGKKYLKECFDSLPNLKLYLKCSSYLKIEDKALYEKFKNIKIGETNYKIIFHLMNFVKNRKVKKYFLARLIDFLRSTKRISRYLLYEAKLKEINNKIEDALRIYRRILILKHYSLRKKIIASKNLFELSSLQKDKENVIDLFKSIFGNRETFKRLRIGDKHKIAYVFFKYGLIKEAQSIFKAILKNKNLDYKIKQRVYFYLGEIFLRENKKEEAGYCFKNVIKKYPEECDEFYLNAAACKRLGRFNESIEWFLQVTTECEEEEKVSAAYFHIGEMKLKINERDAANKYFQKCLTLNPEHKKAREYLVSLNLTKKIIREGEQ